MKKTLLALAIASVLGLTGCTNILTYISQKTDNRHDNNGCESASDGYSIDLAGKCENKEKDKGA